MLFGIKRRRVAKSVINQIRPMFTFLKRRIGDFPAELGKDEYILGYLVATIGILTQMESGGGLSTKDRGLILFEGIREALGDVSPSSEQIALLIESADSRPDFAAGADAAKKVMCTISGFPDYENDPDVQAARDESITANDSLDFLTPNASESSKIAGHLQSRLFFQYAIKRYGRS